MFYESELSFLRNALKKCHIQTLLIDPLMPVDQKADLGLRGLFGDKKQSACFYDYFPEIKPHTIYRLTDMFFCKYIFMLLPDTWDDTLFIIGPYTGENITQSHIFEQGEKSGLSPKQIKQLEIFYSGVPYLNEETYIFAMIDSLGEKMWNGGENFVIIDINRKNTPAFVLPDFNRIASNSDNSSLNLHITENRYEYENELMQAVSLGQFHKAELILKGFSQLSFEKRVPDTLRNLKNYCIIMNTLLRKAAEKGGVHPVYLDSTSSNFAKRIEQLPNMSAVTLFAEEMFRAYCRLVRNNAIKNYTQLVQKTIILIQSDLTADLSLKNIARVNNVSAGYLSALFRKETGKTLTDYVNICRVNYAKTLLETTSLQIQTIAQHCGILDVHYFSKVFKKYVGETPKEYRNKL